LARQCEYFPFYTFTPLSHLIWLTVEVINIISDGRVINLINKTDVTPAILRATLSSEFRRKIIYSPFDVS